MGIFARGGGFPGLVSGFQQGRADELAAQRDNLWNKQQQLEVQKQQLANQGDTAHWNDANAKLPGLDMGAAPSLQIPDVVMSGLLGVVHAGAGMVRSGYNKVFGLGRGGDPHASGPSSQPTTTQMGTGNAAQSAPGPGIASDNGGTPSGAPQLQQPDVSPLGTLRANGGAIPSRGALRKRKGKPGNLPNSKISTSPKLAQPALNQNVQQPPVSPPGNTEPSPSDQDPMLADGGKPKHWIQGAIKHPGALHEDLGVPEGEKIPKAKLAAAAKGKGKTAKRAQLAETMSRFANGGKIAIPPTQLNVPKPQPNAVKQEVANFGDRNRFSRFLKREDSSSVSNKYADGDVVQPANAPYNPDSPEEIINRAAANRAQSAAGPTPATTTAAEPAAAAGAADTAGMTEAEIASAARAAKVGRFAGTIARGAGRFVPGGEGAAALLAPAAIYSAAKSEKVPTSEYRRRLGMDPSGNSILGDTVARTAGVLGDYGNLITGGEAGKFGDWLGGGSSAGNASAAPQPPSNADLTPINPGNHQQMQMPPQAPTSAPTAVPGRNAAPQQGPPRPAAPFDFSKVNIDHTQVPSVGLDQWEGLRKSAIMQMIGHGTSTMEAMSQVDNAISDHQHAQFMEYMGQAQALDAAGNKQGAMAAAKTAYQYMPTGHDIHFGIDPRTNTIVGFGVDQQTGKPVGQPVMMNQQGFASIMSHFADPNNFQKNNIESRKMSLEEAQYKNVQMPLSHAQEYEMGQRGGYFGGRNQTMENTAGIRAGGAVSRLSQQQYGMLEPTIMGRDSQIQDPTLRGEAMDYAAQLVQRGVPAARAAGQINALYQRSPSERAQIIRSLGLEAPGQPSQQQGNSMGGYDPRLNAALFEQ